MSDPYYDPSGTAALAALLLILIPIILILALIFYVIYAFFLMRVFDKAGVQGKWRAWVPVYNSMVLGKLGDTSPWVVLGAIVASSVLSQVPVIGWLLSLVAIAVTVMYSWRVGLKLQREWYWLLLWLIPGVGTLIWLGILAFDSSRWNPAIRPAPWANSFLADKTVWQGVPVQPSAAPAAEYGAPPAYAPPAAPGAYPPPAADVPPAAPPAPPTVPPTAPPTLSDPATPSADEPPAPPRV
ncbi:large exoprotein [Microbacterium sp. NPDC091313]